MEKTNTKRRSVNAGLITVLEDGQIEDYQFKDTQYPEVFDQQAYNIPADQSHSTFSQTSTTSGAAMPPGQPYIPRDNYNDFNTRSHKSSHVLDSVPRPPHVEANFPHYSGQYGTGLRQPPSLTPYMSQGVHENPVSSSSMQYQDAYFVDKPSGQPSRPTLPAVQQESDTDNSNVHDYQHTSAFNFPSNSHLHSVTVPLKFEQLQLNEDKHEVDSTHEVIVFGSDRVGKSTMIHYFLGYHYNPNRAMDQQFKTKGVTAVYRNKELKQTIRLNFLEVDKRDISEAKIKRYEQCEVAVVVFDASSNVSLREANYWIDKTYKFVKGRHVEFILVGNKSDMRNNDDIIMKGLQFASRKKMSFLVTCATNGSLMDVLLENVAMLACSQLTGNNAIESRFKALEENQRLLQLQASQGNQRLLQQLQDTQRIMQQKFEESQQYIQKLEEERQQERELRLNAEQRLREQPRVEDQPRAAEPAAQKKSICIIL